MEQSKEKKSYVAQILAAIAAIALLLGNLETIENFFCPNKKECENAVEKIKIKKIELESADFQLINKNLIKELRDEISIYYQISDCKNSQTDEDIIKIKTKLISLIGEDLVSLKGEFNETIQANLHEHLNLLDLICNLSKICSEQETSQLIKLKSNIK
ncbi:MAG TPA: hypothetical protein PLS40_12965 [Bacteroidia bacterium]|nr:hypothetical protein [Bacteroidia bacterium]